MSGTFAHYSTNKTGAAKRPPQIFSKKNFLLRFRAGEIIRDVKIQRIFLNFRTHVLNAGLKRTVGGLNWQIQSNLFAAQNLNRIDALVQS